MQPDLFTPLRIGDLELPNRILMAPLTRSRAGEGNVPNDLNVEYYRQRAGAGLIITEATQISQQGQGYAWTPGIHSSAQIEGWAKVAEAVHGAGGRIFMQLWHVGRVSHPVFQPGGALPVAPTAMPVPGKTFIIDDAGNGIWSDVPVPQELDVQGIKAIVADYAQAARNAILAGMDGVEIHAANGYLIDQFINSNSNHRSDAYGSAIENRARFLLEVVDAVTAAIGSSRVAVRLTPMGRFMGMGDDTPEETFGYITAKLNERDLAYLHVVEPSTLGIETDSEYDPRWDAIVHQMRRIYDGTLILAGGYDRASADRALLDDRGDAVAFGKLFIANPDLPRRFALGAPLNEPQRDSFFGGDARGYSDYPALAAGSELAA
ncbi:alkene reductase [Novosphingobium sp. PP1Y]|uniref:alkene reductase n=1 Tax=Novosphingobium sp. PP1Y TaxID=702113 RepID=UPI00020EF8DE|nr:alkene reductase [Novosphingobium sp. PP1Y]CCA90750.1 N-ethylmaleimide reductase [Novosphingobium sp. PP1Y]